MQSLVSWQTLGLMGKNGEIRTPTVWLVFPWGNRSVTLSEALSQPLCDPLDSLDTQLGAKVSIKGRW